MKRLFAILLLLSSPLFAQINSARMLSGVNAQTGTSYTFVAADSTRLTTFTNSGSISATLPNSWTSGFGLGTLFSVQNLGPGTLTITCTRCLIFSTGPSGSATLQLLAGQGADIYGGALNYSAVVGLVGGGGIANVSGTLNQISSSGGATPVLSIPSTFIAPGSISSQAINGITNAAAYGGLTQAAIDATPAGGVLDMSALHGTQTIASTITTTAPITIKGCKNLTISCAMPGGDGTKCFDVKAGGFQFLAEDASCVVTQPDNQNIQAAFYLGSGSHFILRNFKIDWNEVGQTASGPHASLVYLTAIRSSASGYNYGPYPTGCNLTDVLIDHIEMTGGGQRGIDFRGSCDVWLKDSYFHDTGYAVGGVGVTGGNSVSIDLGSDKSVIHTIDDIAFSHNTHCINNTVVNHGDSFKCGNFDSHVIGNTVFGSAYVGKPAWLFASGIDAGNTSDSEYVGNRVYDTWNNMLGTFPTCINIGTIDPTCSNGYLIVPRNMSFVNNQFHADAKLNAYGCIDCGSNNNGSTSAVLIGTGYYVGGVQENITIVGNVFDHVELQASNSESMTIANNSFNGLAAASFPAAMYIAGPVTQELSITGNTIANNPIGRVPISCNIIYVQATSFAATITCNNAFFNGEEITITGLTNTQFNSSSSSTGFWQLSSATSTTLTFALEHPLSISSADSGTATTQPTVLVNGMYIQNTTTAPCNISGNSIASDIANPVKLASGANNSPCTGQMSGEQFVDNISAMKTLNDGGLQVGPIFGVTMQGTLKVPAGSHLYTTYLDGTLGTGDGALAHSTVSGTSVNAVIVDAGGVGYTSTPVVFFGLATCSVQPTAHAIIGGGAVTSVVVDTGGTCTAAPDVVFYNFPTGSDYVVEGGLSGHIFSTLATGTGVKAHTTLSGTSVNACIVDNGGVLFNTAPSVVVASQNCTVVPTMHTSLASSSVNACIVDTGGTCTQAPTVTIQSTQVFPILSIGGDDTVGSLFSTIPGKAMLGQYFAPFKQLVIGAAATTDSEIDSLATARRVVHLPDASGTIQLLGGTPAAGQGICQYAAGIIGHCTTALDTGGACTCVP